MSTSSPTASSWRDWGRLARLSLAPSALADSAAGVLLGFHGRWPDSSTPWILMGASVAIYHGAMVLNDWADQEHDAATRPDRPIPSGRIDSTSALTVGTLLLFVGVASTITIGASTALWMGLLAWMAWNYTTRGRGPWIGPLLLGACRAANLGAGLVAAEDSPVHSRGGLSPIWILPPLYGIYVVVVSRLGRMEDAEDEAPIGNRPRPLLLALAALLLAIPFAPLDGLAAAQYGPTPGRGAALLTSGIGAYGLLRLALSRETWERTDVIQAMGASLRRLLIFTAACAFLTNTGTGAIVGTAILAGYPLSWLLRGVFPPS